MVDPVNIEQRTEMVRAQNIKVGMELGGIQVASLADMIKIAELLARGGVAVPVHCRDKPGTVFSLCLQAQEWRMPVMSVINKSYVVSNRGVDRIAYESQLIHAVIERNAPLKNRLRYEIIGEDDDRRCRVWATFKGEDKPHEYISNALGLLREARGRNDQGQLKGSPLWEKDPEVQLFYSASRQWARLFAPDVILGAYTPEDPQWSDAPPTKDVSPQLDALEQKLRDRKAAGGAGERGFDADYVAREASARSTIIEGEAQKGETDDQGSGDVARADSGRQDDTGDRADRDRDEVGSSGTVGDDPEDVGESAGQEGADALDQSEAEVFPPDRPGKAKSKPKGKR